MEEIMNKFTKLILTTAVFATGVMASESYVSGSLNVDGTIKQSQDVEVTGAITVNDGGVFNNNATLAFKDGGALKIVAGSEVTADDYFTANTTYSLGITPIGQYPVGSVKGFLPLNYNGSMLMGLTLSKIEGLNDGWKLVDEVIEIEEDLSYICNTTALDLDPTDDLPTSISWFSEGPQSEVTANIIWEATPQTEEAFIAQVKEAIENSSAPEDEKTRLQNGSTPGGTFDNANGSLDFGAATGEGFSGEVKNGTVKLKDTTSAILTGLKLNNVTVKYKYNSTDTYTAPTVDDSKYITVSYIQGKTDDQAKSECEAKFAEGSTITTFSGTPYGEANDSRLTFPEILANGDLNMEENKLRTGDIPNVVKDYNAGNGLDVNDTINIQFEGSDALKFAGKADGSDQVIEFAGDNSKYTGTASFADEITKVVANGEKTLPVNLDSDMSNIILEINGENTIDNSDETTVKNLKLNSEATLTIAAGTTLNIG